MQRYHRKRHLTLWFVLTIVIAFAIGYAILNRPRFPTQNLPIPLQDPS